MRSVDVADLEIDVSLASLFAQREAFAVVRGISGQIYRDMPGRRTLRFEHEGRRYFLKHHTGVGWAEIFKNLATFKQPVLGAANEVAAIKKLHAIAVPTMTLAAWGRRGLNPAQQESFVITGALEHFDSLEDICKSWHGQVPDRALWLNTVRKVADIAARLHDNGVVHQDFYICHFLVKNFLSDPEADFYLIDLHRALQFRGVAPVRWRIKDIAAVLYSMCEAGVLDDEALSVFRQGYESTHACDKAFWNGVFRKVRQVYERAGRKGLLHEFSRCVLDGDPV